MNKVRFSKFEQLKTEKEYKKHIRNLKKESFFSLLKEQKKIRKNKPIKYSYYEKIKIKSTKYFPFYKLGNIYEDLKEIDIKIKDNKMWAQEMKEECLGMIEYFRKNYGD